MTFELMVVTAYIHNILVFAPLFIYIQKKNVSEIQKISK